MEAVWFNFMTDKEVRKHSVLRVTNANLLDFLERPMPGGLYDPLLGPLEERTPYVLSFPVNFFFLLLISFPHKIVAKF